MKGISKASRLFLPAPACRRDTGRDAPERKLLQISMNQNPRSAPTPLSDTQSGRPRFTRAMRRTHTILLPMMLPLHFSMLKSILEQEGYRAELLTNASRTVVDEGLKYVHNDTCYPALLVIGQFIDALKSGRYDTDRVAVAITQTGGGCRASNYIHLLRKALTKAGFGHVPVLSMNLSGLELNSGLRLTPKLLRKAISAVIYGDMLTLLRNHVQAYEVRKGAAAALTDRWLAALTEQFQNKKGLKTADVRDNLRRMVTDFEQIPVDMTPKVRVGIVGEIYVKYSALANNGLEEFLTSQGCEVCVPGLLSFILYCISNTETDRELYGGGFLRARGGRLVMKYLIGRERLMLDALKNHPRFTPPADFARLTKLADQVIDRGVKMGEGWLLPAEMMELVSSGFPNIVCVQPFGCLPNHICGKGVMRTIKQQNPLANIVAIDYDPGATKVNQENRIKLMLAVARENLEAAMPQPDQSPEHEPTAMQA